MPAALYDHEKLRAWRDQAKLTRTEASHAAGIAYPTLADLEAGRARQPSLEVLTRLAELYGHAPGELLPAARRRGRRMTAEPAAEPPAEAAV
jgi:transcriptional regulator with XRE-family HTH domain